MSLKHLYRRHPSSSSSTTPRVLVKSRRRTNRQVPDTLQPTNSNPRSTSLPISSLNPMAWSTCQSFLTRWADPPIIADQKLGIRTEFQFSLTTAKNVHFLLSARRNAVAEVLSSRTVIRWWAPCPPCRSWCWRWEQGRHEHGETGSGTALGNLGLSSHTIQSCLHSTTATHSCSSENTTTTGF